MPDTPGSTEESTESTEGQESTEETTEETTQEDGSTEEQEQETNEEESQEDESEEGEQVPPEVLRKKLTKAQGEAANYRTKLRALEEQLEGAKTQEEVDKIIADLKVDNDKESRGLLVENVALKHELSDEFTAILSDLAAAGKTREELEAHAKVLQKSAPKKKKESDPAKLKGGLNPSEEDGAFDPVKASREARRRRY